MIDLEKFNTQGYLVIKDFFAKDAELKSIINNIEKIGELFSPNFKIENANSIINDMTPQMRSTFYSGLRYLPAVTRMACSEELINLSRQLGLQCPAVMRSYNLRMDLPGENDNLFHWHQDSTYLLGSKNALTYWIPMSKVSKDLGSISVVPGSHVDGIYPYKVIGSPGPYKSLSPKEVFLVDDPGPLDSIILEAVPGDLVVFNQLLLHASYPGSRDDIRWTVQVRHSDFADNKFIEAGYPMGDHTNIVHTNYLPKK